MYGGLAAYHHTVDGPRREVLPIPDGLPSRLVLAYTGEPRNSGYSNWAMFRRFVDGDSRSAATLEAIARLAGHMRDAILAGDIDEVGRLVGEEGRLRYGLAPTVSTPRLRAVGTAAVRAGALGVKVCGAGGGGCLLAFAQAGRREAVQAAMSRAGAIVIDAPPARRGLQVR
jgi:D-glycero-alpha-D-manno-heptose-7-phosphate kinase